MIKVIWVTNVPAPYRFPVWEKFYSLGADLLVLCIAEDPQRGWVSPKPVNYSFRMLKGWSMQVPGTDVHLYGARVVAALKDADPDVLVINGWDSPTYVAALRWAKKKNCKTVLFYESTPTSHRFRRGPVSWVRRRLLRSFSSWIAVGSGSREALISEGVPPSLITVANNFSAVGGAGEVQSRHSRIESPNLRPSHGDGHVFLFVGRLIPLKNVGMIIRSFNHIARAGDMLRIVGHGPEREKLERETAVLGLEASVVFLGQMQGAALQAEYLRSNTLCLASSREVWGLVVNEALENGLHVVVSARAGVAEAVDHFSTVWVAEPDEAELAIAMEASRAAWVGHRRDSGIDEFSPGKFAESALHAIDLARQIRS